MAEKTAISWCDATANFWSGCTKVSLQCNNCYAERDTNRYAGKPVFETDRQMVKNVWTNIPKWNKEAEKTGIRKRVFVMSLGDFFERLPEGHKDKEEMDDIRVLAMQLMEASTSLDFLVLTKRISNVKKMVFERWLTNWPKHIRLGISVGTQKDADRDIPRLLEIDCPNFLSMEPLLEWVRLRPEWISKYRYRSDVSGLYYTDPKAAGDHQKLPRIEWVITGGESGPQARPGHPDWYRLLRDQCVEASVPFHFKQWGEWCPLPAIDPHRYASPVHTFEDGTRVCRVGRKIAGHLLDGVEHFAFPKETS